MSIFLQFSKDFFFWVSLFSLKFLHFNFTEYFWIFLDTFKLFPIFVKNFAIFYLIVKIFWYFRWIFCRFGLNKYLNILRFRLNEIVVSTLSIMYQHSLKRNEVNFQAISSFISCVYILWTCVGLKTTYQKNFPRDQLLCNKTDSKHKKIVLLHSNNKKLRK